MSKGKTVKKGKNFKKGKISFPQKIKKGQITKTELKSVGFTKPNNKLKNTAPVESIAGIGVKKGAVLREDGVKTVGDYKEKGFTEFFREKLKKREKVSKAKIKKKKSKAPVKKSQRKYYIFSKKTGKVLSEPIDTRQDAKEKQRLFFAPSVVVSSKPENLEKIGISIKKRSDVDPKTREEYDIQIQKEYRRIHQLPDPKPKKKGKYQIIIHQSVKGRGGLGKHLVTIEDTKTGEKLDEWVRFPTVKDEKAIDDLFDFKFDRPKKKIEPAEEFLERIEREHPERYAEELYAKKLEEGKSEVPFLDEQVLEVKDLVKANDYAKSKEYISSETDFIHTIDLLERKQIELDSIERDMGVLKDTEGNRKALDRLNKVQKLTKESLAEWELEKKKFLGKSVKTVKAPRKGNDYITNVLLTETTTKPTPSDWKKVKKIEMRKLVVGVYEAEYGKGSTQAKAAKSYTEDMKSSDLHKAILSFTDEYDADKPFKFQH